MQFTIELFNAFILYFSVLSLASLSGLISERVGITNIAINGMMIVGSTFYAIFALIFRSENMWLQIPLILIATIFGLAFGALHGFATIRLKSNQVISGVAINILASAVALILLQIVGTANRFEFRTNELAASSSPSDPLNIISFKLFLSLALIIVMWVVLNKTKWGLRLRSIGENPQAADVAGINVNSYKWQGVLLSGAFAGAAGGLFVQSLGVAFSGDVQGLGFLALAIMIMGQWKTQWIMLATIAFSFFYALGFQLATLQGNIQDFSRLFLILPFALTLIALAALWKSSKAPKAVGIPYDKSQR
ncbi:ABC transporter permease [[Mycoplasma] mobile]|uniref:Unspecified sugar ABC transport permease protein n=1 Tax=Mycoplasma mobile (strain ATCC 43663 / 163K / NCTC 11711) TaxID=267748 RepID=Q6KIQ1_MYCM1|nr:ABC transporter permease [[Mycoplasma] mobile]AAT27525.1 unspecified sugar ABC transport permease protein [Mycoplasma mobile 163K]